MMIVPTVNAVKQLTWYLVLAPYNAYYLTSSPFTLIRFQSQCSWNVLLKCINSATEIQCSRDVFQLLTIQLIMQWLWFHQG